jgi:hypothetical protein
MARFEGAVPPEEEGPVEMAYDSPDVVAAARGAGGSMP